MQPSQTWQDRIVAKFLRASRQHLCRPDAPNVVTLPRRGAGPSRPTIRSLLLISSLGAAFGGPAVGAEANRSSIPQKSQPAAKRDAPLLAAVPRLPRDDTKP